MAANADILPDLLKLNNLLIAEKDFTVVIENIMDTAANICNADCGFFYTLNDDNFLSLDYSFNKSQRTALRGSDNLTLFQTVYLPERKTKNPKSVVEICYFNNEVVNTATCTVRPTWTTLSLSPTTKPMPTARFRFLRSRLSAARKTSSALLSSSTRRTTTAKLSSLLPKCRKPFSLFYPWPAWFSKTAA